MRKLLHKNTPLTAFLLPSLLGMLALYIVPYLSSYYYSLTGAETGAFVGAENFRSVLMSSAFRTAAINTLVFMVICIPLNMILPFILANALHKRQRIRMFMALFMLPLVLPSGATVFFWRVIFDEYGLLNRLVGFMGGRPVYWFQSELALIVIILVFLCKNIGFNMVLFMTGFGRIPREYYEIAEVDGASRWRVLKSVTMVYLTPTTFMVFLMSIINSFKIFREIFLLFGNYPHTSIYMLQHYMNNQFFSAGLQKLSVASTVISIAVAVPVALLFAEQKRLSGSLRY